MSVGEKNDLKGEKTEGLKGGTKEEKEERRGETKEVIIAFSKGEAVSEA